MLDYTLEGLELFGLILACLDFITVNSQSLSQHMEFRIDRSRQRLYKLRSELSRILKDAEGRDVAHDSADLDDILQKSPGSAKLILRAALSGIKRDADMERIRQTAAYILVCVLALLILASFYLYIQFGDHFFRVISRLTTERAAYEPFGNALLDSPSNDLVFFLIFAGTCGILVIFLLLLGASIIFHLLMIVAYLLSAGLQLIDLPTGSTVGTTGLALALAAYFLSHRDVVAGLGLFQ